MTMSSVARSTSVEGDAYNKVLMDRAERRLNNLGYFKTVKVTTEPGSTPDRIIVDRRCGGSADRRLLDLGRLFDHRWRHRRSIGHRDQFSRPRPLREAGRLARPAFERRRVLLHRSLFPRAEIGGRLRSLHQVPGQHALRALHLAHDGWPAPRRISAHGGMDLHRALRALFDGHRHPEQDDTALQRLLGPDPGHHPAQSGRHGQFAGLHRQWRGLDRLEGIEGNDPHLGAGLHARLQHGRQRQGPAFGPARRAQAGFRRRRRRFEVCAHHGRRQILLRGL